MTVQYKSFIKNQWNFENINFFGPKYVWALTTPTEKQWQENRHYEK